MRIIFHPHENLLLSYQNFSSSHPNVSPPHQNHFSHLLVFGVCGMSFIRSATFKFAKPGTNFPQEARLFIMRSTDFPPILQTIVYIFSSTNIS